MSDMRINGFYSGMDIDQMVKQLMDANKVRVDTVKQERQYLIWEQEAYREIAGKIADFRDEYFDYLNSDTNMRSSQALNSYQVTYNGEDSSEYLSINPLNNSSSMQNYPITQIVTAKSATANGTTLIGDISGETIADVTQISVANDNNKITLSLNDISKEITIDDGLATMDDLVANLQTKIDEAFGTGKVTVGKVGTTGDAANQLKFVTENTNNLNIDYGYNGGFVDIINQDLSEGLTIQGDNNKFELTLNADGTSISKIVELTTGTDLTADQITADTQAQLDLLFGPDKIRVLNENGALAFYPISSQVIAVGELAENTIGATTEIRNGYNTSLQINSSYGTKNITFAEGIYTQSELLQEIQTKLDSAYGSNRVIVSLDDTSKLSFEDVSNDESLNIAKVESAGLEILGFASDTVNKSNKVNLSSSLDTIASFYNTPLAPADNDGDGYDIEFTINEEKFEFDSSITSLNDIISAVNDNSALEVKMRYDELNDSITIETTDTGQTTSITVNDSTGEGNLMTVLGLDGANEKGVDSLIQFDDGTAEGITITRTTNSFTFDGLNFQLDKDYTGSMDLTIDVNADDTYELIGGFVDKYNELVTEINGKLTEKKYYDYKPLTDTQKEEMSDKQIELWEGKAKSGLLGNDSMLQGMLYKMRSALYEGVEGVGLNLYDIGITTSNNYYDGGKLVIDEDKLKGSIKENPQKIIDLFTSVSDNYDEEGLSHRLYDIMQDNISATGSKGLLLQKAGIEGDRSEFDNILYSEIRRYDNNIDELIDELADKEAHYYSMFTRMEKALGQMQSQSQWLMAQLGTQQQ